VAENLYLRRVSEDTMRRVRRFAQVYRRDPRDECVILIEEALAARERQAESESIDIKPADLAVA
jgi:hypothetical protein